MKISRGLCLLLALLVSLSLLTACGAETAAPAEETQPPEETPEMTEAALPEGAVEVGTVDELLAALAPHTTIVLREGEYDLSLASDYGQEDLAGAYSWLLVPGGCQLNIRNLDGLRLVGRGDVSILARPRYADVLHVEGCRDLQLEGLTLGHTQAPGICAAGVLYLEGCEEVRLENCRLFGCGSVGIEARNCQSLIASNCRIDSCSVAAVSASACRDLRLLDCSIADCGLSEAGAGDSLFYAERCTGFALVNCHISGNRVNQLLQSERSDPVSMLGCRVEENRIRNVMFLFHGKGAVVDKCSFQRRSSERYYPSQNIVFARSPEGEDLIGFDLDRMEWARADYDGPVLPEPRQTQRPDGAAEITVSTVDELLAAIAPNTTVILEPGDYVLSSAADYGSAGGEWYSWDAEFDGYSLCIDGVENLQLVGAGRETCRVLTEPRYAAVLRARDCGGLSLSGLTLGHSPEPGFCTGNVLDLEGCREVNVFDCGLFGCGMIGIYARDCDALSVERTEIYDCSSLAASLAMCTNVAFTECSIFDCDEGRNTVSLYGGSMYWNDTLLTEGAHCFADEDYLGVAERGW